MWRNCNARLYPSPAQARPPPGPCLAAGTLFGVRTVELAMRRPPLHSAAPVCTLWEPQPGRSRGPANPLHAADGLCQTERQLTTTRLYDPILGAGAGWQPSQYRQPAQGCQMPQTGCRPSAEASGGTPAYEHPLRRPYPWRRSRLATQPTPATSARVPNAANRLPPVSRSARRNPTTAATAMYLLSTGCNFVSPASSATFARTARRSCSGTARHLVTVRFCRPSSRWHDDPLLQAAEIAHAGWFHFRSGSNGNTGLRTFRNVNCP